MDCVTRRSFGRSSANRKLAPNRHVEVSAFSSHASICGDIFISWGPRFSPYGDTVNLSRCFYSPAILTLCVNPHSLFPWGHERMFLAVPHCNSSLHRVYL